MDTLQNLHTTTWLGLALGSAVALVVGAVVHGLWGLPPDDRRYLDPPPWGFRCVWWPIRVCALLVSTVWPERWLDHTQQRLQVGGLAHQLQAAQFVAGRWVCALAVGAVVWWVAHTYAAHGWPSDPLPLAVLGLAAGYLYPGVWLRDRLQHRRREVLRALPFVLDTVTLCVEAGLNFQGALLQAVTHGPPSPLRDELQRVLRDIRAGKPRADSLQAMAQRLDEPAVTHLCNAVQQAERLGMALGPILRAQADQRRHERFLRAEKLAMQAPVKMLLPLIAFIFPSTFIVLFFPIAIRFMQSGF